MIFTNCTVPYSFSKAAFDHHQLKKINLIEFKRKDVLDMNR
ncbi:hypothetical protein D020_2652 [Vibrio parahaemolyticus SBR10290]|nr:hypothetical protein D021_1293 [Vibrio parahaemolyticus 10296]ESW45215.1 hypothetical protein D022_1237 [Vibrio parahaemolyticus 12310]ETT21402.1 hypothetical protein D023_1831 [Vibrio parahaemolyticus 3256]ETX54163.1 hypothetical protein D020_2652 [Vibrio parahaemolyticus SBR10290]EVU17309.1 hypothetical protein D046_3054 [Vibrio parahaemolyticus V-223/04]